MINLKPNQTLYYKRNIPGYNDNGSYNSRKDIIQKRDANADFDELYKYIKDNAVSHTNHQGDFYGEIIYEMPNGDVYEYVEDNDYMIPYSIQYIPNDLPGADYKKGKIYTDERITEAMDAPYTKQQIMKGLRDLTNNFTKEDGSVRTGYKEEKEIIKEILRGKYKYVNVSDARIYDGEPMSWVIAYSTPNGTSVKIKEAIDWNVDEEEDDDDELMHLYDLLTGEGDAWYLSDTVSARGRRWAEANPGKEIPHTASYYTVKRPAADDRIGVYDGVRVKGEEVRGVQICADDRFDGYKIQNPTPRQVAYIENVARSLGCRLSRGNGFIRIYF